MLGRVVFWLIAAAVFGSLYWTHVEIAKGNSCEMTWMWRRIFLTPVKVENNSNTRYSLVHYTEGFQYNKNYEGTSSDVVVLFVPGSGGSGFQVRSLASVMLNKTEMARSKFVPQFYAVDFDEELSFVSGNTLLRQRDFVVKAVQALKKRHSRSTFNKIILYGHSFGGVVIRSLPGHPDFDSSYMDLVITLASPLQKSPLVLDRKMVSIYKTMRSFWTEHGDTTMAHVGLLSYSGGEKDIQVADWLASTANTYHLPSWAVRRVDTSVDHLCILWCNMLVRHSSRLLMAYIEEKRASPNTTAQSSVATFHKAEMARSATTHLGVVHVVETSFLPNEDKNSITDSGVITYTFDLKPYRAIRFSVGYFSECAGVQLRGQYPTGLVTVGRAFLKRQEKSVLFLPQEASYSGNASVTLTARKGCDYSLTWKEEVFDTWYTLLTGFINRTAFLVIASLALNAVSEMAFGESKLWSVGETCALCFASCNNSLTLGVFECVTVCLIHECLHIVTDVLFIILNRISLPRNFWLLMILSLVHPNISYAYITLIFSKGCKGSAGRSVILASAVIAVCLSLEGGPRQFVSYITWNQDFSRLSSMYYPFIVAWTAIAGSMQGTQI